MLTLDTSGILASLNKQDPHHAHAVAVLRADGGPFIVPAGIMAEVTYMIGARLGAEALDAAMKPTEPDGSGNRQAAPYGWVYPQEGHGQLVNQVLPDGDRSRRWCL